MSSSAARVRTNAGQSWPMVELGSVCDIQLGKMLSPKSKIGVRPIPYLRNENVQWDHFDLSDVSWMDFTEQEEAKFILKPGDLLVCEGGEPGRAAIWNGEIGRCCYQKALHRIRPIKGLVHPPFVLYRLWLSSLKGQFTSSQTQTTIAHLPRQKLIRLLVPLPGLVEQKRIAKRLRSQLVAVERARAAARDRLDAALALPAAYLREVFEGASANGWERVKIGDLAETRSGATPSRSQKSYFGGGIPWVKTGELKDGTICAEGSTEETVSPLALEECALSLLPPGTLLIAMYGQGKTRGRTGLLMREGTTNQACFAILPNPDAFDSRILQYWFRANYARLRGLTEGRGGNQPNLNGVLLRDLEVTLPPLQEQSRIADDLAKRLAAAKKLAEAIREELNDLDALPASLLRDAFQQDR